MFNIAVCVSCSRLCMFNCKKNLLHSFFFTIKHTQSATGNTYCNVEHSLYALKDEYLIIIIMSYNN
jgi:hypothetical protein